MLLMLMLEARPGVTSIDSRAYFETSGEDLLPAISLEDIYKDIQSNFGEGSLALIKPRVDGYFCDGSTTMNFVATQILIKTIMGYIGKVEKRRWKARLRTMLHTSEEIPVQNDNINRE